MGKVVSKVAIGVGIAAAAIATAGAAIPALGIGAALGTALGVSAATAGTILGGIATASLVGVQYLMRPSSASAGSNLPSFTPSGSGIAPTPIRQTLRQSDVPRCFIFGRTRTSGAYFLYETDNSKNLYQGIYICDGPVDGFDAVICDDEFFAPKNSGNGYILDGNANVFVPGKYSNGTPSIKWVKDPRTTDSSVTYTYVNGKWVPVPVTTTTTAVIKDCALIAFEPVNATIAGYNSYIMNTLRTNYSTPAMNGVWTASHLGNEITCIYTWASTNAIEKGGNGDRMKYFPNAWPQWSVVVRGARIYDPRKDSTNGFSGSHRILYNGVWTLYNPTWEYSENPALIAAHYVMWLISQKLTAIKGVDWSSIADAAQYCDGTRRTVKNYYTDNVVYEPFARISGVFYFNMPPREFLANIMASCDGSYGIDKNGNFTMWIAQWETPAVTFTETDISSFVEEFVEPASEALNEIHITYLEPRQNYQRFEAPTWVDTASQATVGKRIGSMNFDMITSPGQAYRMAQRHARRINGKKKVTLTLGPRGMLAVKQRVVGLSAGDPFNLSGTWRVESLVPDGTLSRWQATLRETTEDMYLIDNDIGPTTDPITALTLVAGTTPEAPPYLLTSYFFPYTNAPVATIVISVDTNKNDPTLPASVINENALLQDQTAYIEGSYSTDNVNWSPMLVPLSNTVITQDNRPRNTTYYVRARFVSLNGTYSAWSATQTIAVA